MSQRDELDRAGFRDDCLDCAAAVRRGVEACRQHYVPTHRRIGPRTCPGCGGWKASEDERCGRCRASE